MSKSSDNRPKILIVEDQLQVRAVLCELLELRYNCSQASFAEEALKVLNGDKSV
jgi:CheY-like chemotaxis protein